MTNPNTPTGASAVTDEMVAAATKHSRIDSHGQFIPMRAIKDVYLAMRALEPPPSPPASVVTVPPREYLDLVQGLLIETNKHLCGMGLDRTNFEDDMELAIAQTKAHLAAAPSPAQPRDLEGENKRLKELLKLKNDALKPFAKAWVEAQKHHPAITTLGELGALAIYHMDGPGARFRRAKSAHDATATGETG